MNCWSERFMKLASVVSKWSKDPSTKVGAVIANYHDHKIRSLGFNGFPRGVLDTEERLNDRPTKYKLIVHAEANALLNAEGSIVGCTLYTTKFPCSDCAKLIIQAGVSKVVYGSRDERWAEDAKFSELMFDEASVSVIHLTLTQEGSS